MRFISLLIITISISTGGYLIWNHQADIRSWVQEVALSNRIQTLEIRHSAESLMEAHRKELLIDSEHIFLDPRLKFYPYLLMEVKYSRAQDRTVEGVILWSLVDGEMVLNTQHWEKTHGFTDCINSGADRNDFKIINALATTKSGVLDRETLSRFLNVDNEKLDLWLESCRKKSLIVQSGNNFRLHLQNPRLQVQPETKLDHWLVTTSSKNVSRIAKKFRGGQIETIAKAAFGGDFAIRRTTEVFLPVYSITIQNPDGSQMTTFWNALNGKKIDKPYVLE